MKMVAAAKLRKAQDKAEAGRPYAEKMERMLGSLANGVAGAGDLPKLMTGTGRDDIHVLIAVTADRGLCGGFNGQMVRETRRKVDELRAQGKTVKLICVGRKSGDLLKSTHGDAIIARYDDVTKNVDFSTARDVADRIIAMVDDEEADVVTLMFNEFRSVISQKPTAVQLVPLDLTESDEDEAEDAEKPASDEATADYEFEPSEEAILQELLPRNLGVQLYRSLLESAAGEQAARMTAMDNATRNAGEMIKDLTLQYNRTRQAFITKELIEIISGAEAV
ncbi:MAG: F0F1 ATP synthase subunit gamma [Alphaproteobacteria bacterium]